MFETIDRYIKKSAIKKSILLYAVIFACLAFVNLYIALLVLIFVLVQHTRDIEHNRYLTDNMPFPYLIIQDKKIIYADAKALEIKDFKAGKSINEYIYEFDTNLSQQKFIIENNIYSTYTCETNIDRTYKIIYLIRNDDEQKRYVGTVVGLIMLDNYDEAMQTVEEIKKPLLTAVIDRKLNKLALDFGGIIKKFEHDKYIFIFSQDKLAYFKEKKFYILDQIREIDMGNEFPITLSIGIGIGKNNLNQAMDYARAALDLALGRGGDQVIIKDADKFYFFGDKQTEINPNTRVRARVKTYVFKELISEASNVIVMGHKNPDPDCLGAAIGVYKFVTSEGKDCRIILNGSNDNIKNIYQALLNSPAYMSNVFIGNDEVPKFLADSSLIVIVDTHRPSLVDCPSLLESSSRIVVFDHHRKNVEFINNTVMNYYEPYASSTAELVSEMLQINDVKLSPLEADSLLAGITIDTKNFTLKTGIRTYEMAAFLKRKGADASHVKSYFRDDLPSFKFKADAIYNMETILLDGKKIAIAVCNKKDSPLLAAQTADEILNLDGFAASFVLCQSHNKILISARSLGDINVQLITEKLNGGGHFTASGAQLDKISIKDAIQKLKEAIQN